MKPRRPLILSGLLNLALAAIWIAVALRRPSAQPTAAMPAGNPTKTPTRVTAGRPQAATVVSNAPFDWSLIESDDYHQYVANLRSADCPERTVRDIIAADIEELYAAKHRVPPLVQPLWQNLDRRRAAGLAQRAKESALQDEKLKLIQEVLGYEWENRADELWDGDFGLSKFLGFLPDTKSLRLRALAERYNSQANDIKEAANNILIEEDRVQLRKLYDGLMNDASQLLTPTERDELELRVQAYRFLSEREEIRWDGVAITTAQLREFVRLSKQHWDAWQEEFLSVCQPSPAVQARRKAEFEAQIEKLFGPAHYAEYRRAQDPDFRETWAFMQEQNLPLASAIRVYEIRRAAEEQAGKLKADDSLSLEERNASLAVLKSASTGKLSGALGETGPEYLETRGQWLEKLQVVPEARAQPNQEP
jgi:hypothetical protein